MSILGASVDGEEDVDEVPVLIFGVAIFNAIAIVFTQRIGAFSWDWRYLMLGAFLGTVGLLFTFWATPKAWRILQKKQAARISAAATGAPMVVTQQQQQNEITKGLSDLKETLVTLYGQPGGNSVGGGGGPTFQP